MVGSVDPSSGKLIEELHQKMKDYLWVHLNLDILVEVIGKIDMSLSSGDFFLKGDGGSLT